MSSRRTGHAKSCSSCRGLISPANFSSASALKTSPQSPDAWPAEEQRSTCGEAKQANGTGVATTTSAPTGRREIGDPGPGLHNRRSIQITTAFPRRSDWPEVGRNVNLRNGLFADQSGVLVLDDRRSVQVTLVRAASQPESASAPAGMRWPHH